MAESENRTYPDQYLLRMPSGLRDRIKIAAFENGRSMNSEIISVLEEKYPPSHERGERLIASLFYALLNHSHVDLEEVIQGIAENTDAITEKETREMLNTFLFSFEKTEKETGEKLSAEDISNILSEFFARPKISKDD